MSDTPDPGTMSAREVIDQLCDDFEKGWLSGNPAPLTDVVNAATESMRSDLFRELLAAEREYRTKDGRPVTVTEARRRFAVFGPWTEPIIQELLAVTQQYVDSGVSGRPHQSFVSARTANARRSARSR